jgi:hypothetical protein
VLTEAEKGVGTLKRLRGIGLGLHKIWERSQTTASDQAPAQKAGSGKASSKKASSETSPEQPSPEKSQEQIAPIPPQESTDQSVPSPVVVSEVGADEISPDTTVATSLPETMEETPAAALEDWGDEDLPTENVENEVQKPEQPKGTLATSSPSAKVGIIQQVRNFFQGRKSHGKRFVRPEDVPSGSSTPNPPVTPTDAKVKPTRPAPSEVTKPQSIKPEAIKPEAIKPELVNLPDVNNSVEPAEPVASIEPVAPVASITEVTEVTEVAGMTGVTEATEVTEMASAAVETPLEAEITAHQPETPKPETSKPETPKPEAETSKPEETEIPVKPVDSVEPVAPVASITEVVEVTEVTEVAGTTGVTEATEVTEMASAAVETPLETPEH